MKRVFALILVLTLVLCGCGGGTAETSAPSTVPETTVPETTVPETTVPPETTLPPETTEPAPVDTNPLTGEALDAVSNLRPTAIMVNNISKAAPQCGISQADILYEVLAEGSITRFLAIFSDVSEVGEIGPVRSARPYFFRLAQHYGTIYFSAGGSEEAMNLINNLDYDYLNGIGNAGSYFYRDSWRKNNRGFEHSLMTTGEKLAAAAENKGLDTTVEDHTNYGLLFDDTAIPAGDDASKIEIHFYKGGKLTRMTHDAATNRYTMYQHGATATDANDDTEVTFRNVVVLFASTKITDNVGHLDVQTTGQGEGYLCRDGKVIPIQWSRDSFDDLYTYTDANGNPVAFGVGNSYIAIVPTDSNIDFTA